MFDRAAAVRRMSSFIALLIVGAWLTTADARAQSLCTYEPGGVSGTPDCTFG